MFKEILKGLNVTEDSELDLWEGVYYLNNFTKLYNVLTGDKITKVEITGEAVYVYFSLLDSCKKNIDGAPATVDVVYKYNIMEDGKIDVLGSIVDGK